MATNPIQLRYGHPVDRLGEIKAEIAQLKTVEKQLIHSIEDMGPGAHDGYAYRATVSEVADSTAPDPKAMEAKLRELGVDNRWFSKHQKIRSGYTTVKVVSRLS